MINLPTVPNVTFSPPGDVTWNRYFQDQQTALKSLSDQVDILPSVFAKKLPTPYDFHAVGDGNADDTAAIQAWLKAIENSAGYGAPGNFKVTSTLVCFSNTTVYGSGTGSFIITMVDNTMPMMVNSDFGSGNVNIAWYNTCFQGDPPTTVKRAGNDMVALITVTGYYFHKCLFQHWRLKTFATSGSSGAISHCEFNDWGATDAPETITASSIDNAGTGYAVNDIVEVNGSNIQTKARIQIDIVAGGAVAGFHYLDTGIGYSVATGVTTTTITGVGTGFTIDILTVAAGTCRYEGGPAVWFNNTCSNSFVDHNYFHDGNWTAIFLGDVSRFLVDTNHIRTVREGGVVGGGSYININNNTIYDVQRKDCSSQGMELTLFSSNVTNNNTVLTDLAGIYFLGASVVTCSGNTVDLPNQLNSPPSGRIGAITVNGIGSIAVDTLTIMGNTCSSRDTKCPYGISVLGGPYNALNIGPNNLGPAFGNWNTAPTYIASTSIIGGINSVVRWNNPSGDMDPYSGTVGINATGTTTITGIPFVPRTLTMKTIIAGPDVMWSCYGTVNQDLTQYSLNPSGEVDIPGTPSTVAMSSTANFGPCIKIYAGDGVTVLAQAAVSGWTADGFTLVTSTCAAPFIVLYTATP